MAILSLFISWSLSSIWEVTTSVYLRFCFYFSSFFYSSSWFLLTYWLFFSYISFSRSSRDSWILWYSAFNFFYLSSAYFILEAIFLLSFCILTIYSWLFYFLSSISTIYFFSCSSFEWCWWRRFSKSSFFFLKSSFSLVSWSFWSRRVLLMPRVDSIFSYSSSISLFSLLIWYWYCSYCYFIYFYFASITSWVVYAVSFCLSWSLKCSFSSINFPIWEFAALSISIMVSAYASKLGFSV